MRRTLLFFIGTFVALFGAALLALPTYVCTSLGSFSSSRPDFLTCFSGMPLQTIIYSLVLLVGGVALLFWARRLPHD